MNTKNIKNNLIRRLQRLPSDKLSELSVLMEKIERKIKSKDKTVSYAGSWSDFDQDVFRNLTDDLHKNRIDDRSID